jgi:hypothetical protein
MFSLCEKHICYIQLTLRYIWLDLTTGNIVCCGTESCCQATEIRQLMILLPQAFCLSLFTVSHVKTSKLSAAVLQ